MIAGNVREDEEGEGRRARKRGIHHQTKQHGTW